MKNKKSYTDKQMDIIFEQGWKLGDKSCRTITLLVLKGNKRLLSPSGYKTLIKRLKLEWKL